MCKFQAFMRGYVKALIVSTHTHSTGRGNTVRCTDDQLYSYHFVLLCNNEATVELVTPVQRVSATLNSQFSLCVERIKP